MLIDRYGRVHDYLRISLTDKCNLRCTYCMPENPCFLNEKSLMSDAEILGIASVFVKTLGIKKIRLTGGEPTLRKNFPSLLRNLAGLGAKIALTINGVLLHMFLDDIQAVGMQSINISLDSLNEEKFSRLTRRDHFRQVRENIRQACERGLKVKLNMVVIRAKNSDEVLDFIQLTRDLPLHVRFIEFMPFGGNRWLGDQVVPAKEMLDSAVSRFDIQKLEDEPNSTARSWKLKGGTGSFAFISTVTESFCAGCNRIRLTADGKIRNCLFGTREWDLLSAWRKGEDIVPLVEEAILEKFPERGGLPEFNQPEAFMKEMSERPMVGIGG